MRIHNRHDFAELTSHETSSHALGHIHVLDVEGKPHAMASNGRVACCVPVDMDADDKLGSYPAIAFRMARQAFLDQWGRDEDPPLTHASACYSFSLVGNGIASVDGVKIEEPLTKKVPDLDWLLSKCSGKAMVSFHIDARLLDAAVRGLGNPMLKLEFRGVDKPVVVRSADYATKGFALVMPLTSCEPEELEAKKAEAVVEAVEKLTTEMGAIAREANLSCGGCPGCSSFDCDPVALLAAAVRQRDAARDEMWRSHNSPSGVALRKEFAASELERFCTDTLPPTGPLCGATTLDHAIRIRAAELRKAAGAAAPATVTETLKAAAANCTGEMFGEAAAVKPAEAVLHGKCILASQAAAAPERKSPPVLPGNFSGFPVPPGPQEPPEPGEQAAEQAAWDAHDDELLAVAIRAFCRSIRNAIARGVRR